MASFDAHCRDCECLLGSRHEAVHRWLDELFLTEGTSHRRLRHHWEGVREAARQFGVEGAKGAIVHIVRDCGGVPGRMDYHTCKVDALGIGDITPEELAYDGLHETAADRFRSAVVEQWAKLDKLNS